MQTGLGPVTRVEEAGPEWMHVEGEGEGGGGTWEGEGEGPRKASNTCLLMSVAHHGVP